MGLAQSLRHFLAFSMSFWAISIASTVKNDLVEAGDCEEHSKRSMCKRLFHNLQVVCCLMEGWIVYLYKYK